MGERLFAVDPERSGITVRGRSTLHAITLQGRGVAGTVRLDADQGRTGGGEIEVPLTRLGGGDPLTDLKLRDYLGTRSGPSAWFRWQDAEIRTVGGRLETEVRGVLEFQERRQALTVRAVGTLHDDTVRAAARFELTLSGLGLEAPKLLFMKVDDRIEIEVEVVAQATSQA